MITYIDLNWPEPDPKNLHVSEHAACAIYAVPPHKTILNAWFITSDNKILPADPFLEGTDVENKFGVTTPQGSYLVARCIHTGTLLSLAPVYVISQIPQMRVEQNWKVKVVN